MQATSRRFSFSGFGGTLLSGAAGAWSWLHVGGDALVAALSPSTYTRPVRAIAARQICVSAWQVLPGVILVSALLSYVVIRIVVTTARDYGLSPLALDLFLRLFVLELVPLFVALFVALRSGAALATEVALMRARGSTDAQAADGENSLRAQLLPRGIGNAVAVVALTVIGCVVALAVAYVGLYGFSPWGHAAFARTVGQAFDPLALAGFALKLAFFALAVGVIPAAASLGTPRDTRSVPQAAPRGLVWLFIGLALVEALSLAVRYV